MKVAALIGRVEQAVRDVQQGVDIIIAQGYEAGGHTGEVATMVLIPDVVDAVAPCRCSAAGGIGSGRQMAAAMALGADGVWTGSIWLTVTENDSSASSPRSCSPPRRPTPCGRGRFTGKPARQLRTAWTEAWEAPESPGTLPMPLQFILNAYATRKMGANPPRELVGMPVGQIVSRMNQVRIDQAGRHRDGRGVRRRHHQAGERPRGLTARRGVRVPPHSRERDLAVGPLRGTPRA